MEFTPWTLLTDIGIISAFLLLGKWARARLTWLQRLGEKRLASYGGARS